jgi:DNA polymerase III subunit beta
MKFIVSSSALLRELQSLSGVLGSNNALRILDNFLFDIEKGSLSISASDLETTMTTSLQVEAKTSGRIAIPAKILLDTLKTFPEQPLTFSIDERSYNIEISSDYGKYRMTGFDANEFPKLPSAEGTTSVTIPATVLLDALNKTLFATSTDELRPVMTGVFFHLGKKDLTFVATDAHKLVRYRRTDAKSPADTAFVLPKKPLTLLKNLLTGKADADLKINYNSTNTFFEFANVSLICRLIDGRYPNYEAVIPHENPNVLTVDRAAFLNSVRRVSLYASKTTYQVRLGITGSELTISAEDPDFSNEAKERLSCQFSGEDMDIGFNAKFLIEILANLESDEINLNMSTPNRAGIITPQSDNKDEDILMLVMPVMINTYTPANTPETAETN